MPYLQARHLFAAPENILCDLHVGVGVLAVPVRADPARVVLVEHGAAHHHAAGRAALPQQPYRLLHRRHRRRHQRGKPAQPDAVPLAARRDLFWRHVFAEVDHRIAVVFQHRFGDILSDIAIYVPFLYVLNCNVWLIFLFTVLTIISETVGIMGVQINASRHYEGPMGKSDRAFWLGLLAIVCVFTVISVKALGIFTAILSFLLLYTIFNRINGALKEAGSAETK